jgi:hypothetical protein
VIYLRTVFLRYTNIAKKWLGKFGQIDNWLSCLTAAMLPHIRSEHDEANTPDTQPRLQGKGGLGSH